MVPEDPVYRRHKPAVDHQPRTVTLPYTFIGAIQHDEMHGPKSRGINRRNEHTLASAATVFFPRFESHGIAL